MSQAFYRKYRSKNLGEVVGQNHITEVLEKSLTKGKISHAYLFTGPRGVGKTSIARILAHQINDLPYSEEDQHPDIIEIDAASNNGVDEIRNLREQIQVAPFSAKYRVYIIDEVHMLSKAAFNALLKTLEEPPEHAVFILATTDAHKIPATIISRTQQFVFHYISKADIVKHLSFIAEQENIKISPEALEIIAERGSGSFRDSISLLDQLSSVSNEEITASQIEAILGLAPKKQIADLIMAYEFQDIADILNQIETIRNSGVDLRIFTEQLISEIKNVLSDRPHLVKLLMPLQKAKNSNFLDLELISILVESGDKPIFLNTNSLQNKTNPPQPIKQEPVLKQEVAIDDTSIQNTKPKEERIENNLKTKKSLTESIENTESNNNLEKTTLSNDKSKPVKELKDFKWHDFLQAIKAKEMGIGTILAGRAYEKSNGKILIYAERPLHKKQLTKPTSIQAINDTLHEIGGNGWQIEIIAGAKPPLDADAAKVLELMGGGEEVEINE